MADNFFEESEFQLSNVNLGAKWWNKGEGPLLIALHGWMDNANSFDELARALSGQQLLAIDLAGHGNSSHRSSYDLWQYAWDIAELMSDTLAQPATVIGHSLGGIVSLFLPHLIPNHCKSLVLIDSLGPLTEEATDWPKRINDSWTKQKKLLRDLGDKKARYPDLSDAAKARSLSPVAPLDEKRAGLLMERNLVQAGEGGWDLKIDRKLMIPSPLRLTEAHAKSLIEPLRLPVTIVLASDGVGKLPYQERLELFHQPEVHLMEGDHHLHMQPRQAAELARLIEARL